MYRPWWFIEYSPKEQKIWDIVYKIIEKNYSKFWYQHIHTPAVESVDILKKWWDEVSKQIFGLYGLAQGTEDVKDYALHFDLTVPFARYVLDWQNELAFPFKRYQIQPVWRWERTQKWRYKEFWQADIDVIWKTWEREMNDFYDADCVMTLASTLREIFDTVGLEDKEIVIRYNNKLFMKSVCDEIGLSDSSELFALLDKYYKLSKEEFDSRISDILSDEQKSKLFKLRELDKYKNEFPWYEDCIIPFASKLRDIKWVKIVYDPSIVRGLDYYTGIVFETFVEDRKDLWSVCSGGAYWNMTDMIDKKRSFSGVGGSIGLSRLVSVLIDDYKLYQSWDGGDDSYLIINNGTDYANLQDILDKLHSEWKIAEIYHKADKLDKQFKYAEKKWISHIVNIFDGVVKVKKIGGEWNVLGNWNTID